MTIAIPWGLAIASFATLSHQGSMLLEQPGLEAAVNAKSVSIGGMSGLLIGFQRTSLSVSIVGGEMRAEITTQEVEDWVAGGLKRANVRVLTATEKEATLRQATQARTEQSALMLFAEFHSRVRVVVSGGQLSSGWSLTHVRFSVERGVFCHPGAFLPAIVYEYPSSMSLGRPTDSIKEQIRIKVNLALDDFIQALKAANGGGQEESTLRPAGPQMPPRDYRLVSDGQFCGGFITTEN